MKTDYLKRFSDLTVKENQIRAKKAEIVLEWAKEFCEWADELKQANEGYCYLKTPTGSYMAVKNVRNSFVRVSKNVNASEGVMGSIILEGLLINTQVKSRNKRIFLDRTFYTEFFAKTFDSFEVVPKEVFDQVLKNVIETSFSQDPENINLQHYYTTSDNIKRIKDLCPDFLDIPEVNNFIIALEAHETMKFSELDDALDEFLISIRQK